MCNNDDLRNEIMANRATVDQLRTALDQHRVATEQSYSEIDAKLQTITKTMYTNWEHSIEFADRTQDRFDGLDRRIVVLENNLVSKDEYRTIIEDVVKKYDFVTDDGWLAAGFRALKKWTRRTTVRVVGAAMGAAAFVIGIEHLSLVYHLILSWLAGQAG